MSRTLDPLTGPCDCKYKASCHVPRQHVASVAKEEIPEYKCRFFEWFEKDRAKERKE